MKRVFSTSVPRCGTHLLPEDERLTELIEGIPPDEFQQFFLRIL